MKSQILTAKVIYPYDNVRMTVEVTSTEECIFFTAVVSKDDELFSEFLKHCKKCGK